MLLRPLRRNHDKKVYFFISALLHSLHRNDEKKSIFSLLLIATTFTASWLCQENIFLMATTFTTPWSWQKYVFSFQHYVHYILIMTKNILFFISVLRSLGPNHVKYNFAIATTFTTLVIMTIFLLCCCYVHYTVISTTSTTSWLRKKIFYFSFQHYVHYVLITTENTFIFIPTARSLRDKFSGSIRFVKGTVFSPSGISVES